MTRFSHAPVVPVTVKNKLSKYPELLQILLFHRGFTDEETAEKFLHPDYDRDTHDPFLLSDMELAVSRIFDAIEKNEKITIYADFDADGIPGAVILHDFFKKIAYENFDIYIPHRHNEGYGVHRHALEKLAEKGTQLIITVDVGITYADEVAFAGELGMDVIITDHHEPSGTLPKAVAVVNPKLGDYPDPMICGAAVAWKLVCAMVNTLHPQKNIEQNDTDSTSFSKRGLEDGWSNLSPGWEKWLLDMVGIATISDMVPLVNENRVLATYGLKVLQKTRRLGLQKIFSKTYIYQKNITEDDVAFTITPRINAASRMAHPMDAFQVLAATDHRLAGEAVDHLVQLNDQRKKLVAQTVKQARVKLKKREIRDIIVIGDPEWSTGISGLVATKIVEEYGRPAFVWSVEGGVVKGSCRGIGSMSVVKLMEAVPDDTFIQFGGHRGAGGFSMEKDQIHFLEEKFMSVYQQLVAETSQEKEDIQQIESILTLDDVTMQNHNTMEQCAPFGVGNPKPLFLFENIVIDDIHMFGKSKEHLELTFQKQDGNVVKAIHFYKTIDDFQKDIQRGDTIHLIAQFDYSIFRGKGALRLRIVDIQ